MRKLIVATILVFGSLNQAWAELVKSDSYKPFTVISTKLKKEMTSDYIMDALACRSVWQAVEANVDLLKNYDLIDSDDTDGSMSITTFAGKQDGKNVRVSFLVETSSHILYVVQVNGQAMIYCTMW